MHLQFRLLTIVAAVGLIACGKKSEPEAPAPQPTPTANQPAPTPPSEDAAAKAAREQAERDRLAREAAERAAADRATALQQLVAMIHFDFDKADILSDDVSNLDRKAAILQANTRRPDPGSGHATSAVRLSTTWRWATAAPARPSASWSTRASTPVALKSFRSGKSVRSIPVTMRAHGARIAGMSSR